MNLDPTQMLGTGDGRNGSEESTDETDGGHGSLRRRLTLAAAGLGTVWLVRRVRGGSDDGASPAAGSDAPSDDADDGPSDDGDGSLADDATADATGGGRSIGRKLGGVVVSAVLVLLVRKVIRRRGDGSTN